MGKFANRPYKLRPPSKRWIRPERQIPFVLYRAERARWEESCRLATIPDSESHKITFTQLNKQVLPQQKCIRRGASREVPHAIGARWVWFSLQVQTFLLAKCLLSFRTEVRIAFGKRTTQRSLGFLLTWTDWFCLNCDKPNLNLTLKGRKHDYENTWDAPKCEIT